MSKFGDTYYLDRENLVWRNRNAASFHYSDGDNTENRIREILNSVKDKSVASDELKIYQTDWPTAYYFSGNRANLLRPFEKTLLAEARVLELGCGMGAVTRYLGEVAREVWAVEGSLRRASTAAIRCGDLSSVNIIVDDIMALPDALGKFDVVTLVGVLEYARRFGGANAEEELLRKAAGFLAPGGRLILALENKLGLKYFGGVPEDHLNARWAGLTNGYAENGVRTWSRKELLDKLHRAGFANCEQFLALPDYKLPVSVVSEEALKMPAVEFNLAPLLSGTRRPFEEAARFNMAEAWKSLAAAGLVREMADSLCFVCGLEEEGRQVFEKGVLAHHYGGSFAFADKFAKEVRIEKLGERIVCRRKRLGRQESGEAGKLFQRLEDEPYYSGPLLIDAIRQVAMQPNWTREEFFAAFAPWVKTLRENADGDGKCPGTFLDYTPFNLVNHKDKWVAFDQEWASSEPIPLPHLIYRGLRYTLSRIWPFAKTARHELKTFVDVYNEYINYLDLPQTWPLSADYWWWREQKLLKQLNPNPSFALPKNFPLLYMNT